MLEFLSTTYLSYAMDVYFNRQSVSQMGTNYALLLADLFIYSYEADFIADLVLRNRSASYIDLPLKIAEKGTLMTKLCDKRDDFISNSHCFIHQW